ARAEQDAPDRDVSAGTPARGPGRPRRQRHRQQEPGRHDEADQKEVEGLGEADAELGDHEAARPQQDEERRHEGVPDGTGSGGRGSGHAGHVQAAILRRGGAPREEAPPPPLFPPLPSPPTHTPPPTISPPLPSPPPPAAR